MSHVVSRLCQWSLATLISSLKEVGRFCCFQGVREPTLRAPTGAASAPGSLRGSDTPRFYPGSARCAYMTVRVGPLRL